MTIEKIATLVAQFQNRTLPIAEWTHEAHLVAAIYYNWDFDEETAFQKMKSNIITYNRSVGVENTNDAGYHETITIFWMRLIRKYLNENKFETIEMACHQFIQSELSSKDILLEYYSEDVLFSEKARLEWVEGDIEEFPNNFIKKV